MAPAVTARGYYVSWCGDAMFPPTVTSCPLWQGTLAPRDPDALAHPRERLRSSLLSLRERAGVLAAEIRRDLPDLTRHDLSHLDALWETAAAILGGSHHLTPTEGFVFGAAVLLHDLAMSVAATPGGLPALQRDPRWADLVVLEYQSEFDRVPTPAVMASPPAGVFRRALFGLLRQVHAENAEKLAFLSYTGSTGDIFLIEDTEIRQTFGRLIGQIAHSHWWSLDEVERRFSRVTGAPHWAPAEWTVDPMRLACLLRTADAAHLDGRRAPLFQRAITKISATASDHWDFQEKLNRVYVQEDALVFTSSQAFRLPDASSWWLCLETLRAVDRELKSVDALFADKAQPRFAARRVAGVDSPERLASFVQTDAWLPISAMIHVTDLPTVIKSIGGNELYGRRPAVALRELIQNSADAIRARRLVERRGSSFGSIVVSLVEDPDARAWLEVCDTGLGMSQRVLTEYLLDFGRSFWGSPAMQEEYPGLLASDFQATGKYGIGFFSAFMVADRVQVLTRRSDAAARETLVLEFASGLSLSGRPILRPATSAEQLIDGGTRVRLQLRTNPRSEGGLLYRYGRDTPPWELEDLCRHLAPALDADLSTSTGQSLTPVIAANDWLSIRGEDLLQRMEPLSLDQDPPDDKLADFRVSAAGNLRPLLSADGVTVGRACITAGYGFHGNRSPDLGGVVTVGGLRACGLTGICGVLAGTPRRASRDAAEPLVPAAELRRWASEQAAIVSHLWPERQSQTACAQYIRLCGGATGPLPIARFRGAWISADQIRAAVSELEEVLVCCSYEIDDAERLLPGFALADNLFVTESTGIPGLLQAAGSDVRWPHGRYTSFTMGGSPMMPESLGGAVLEAIAVGWGLELDALPQHVSELKSVSVGTDGERPVLGRATRVLRRSGATCDAGQGCPTQGCS